MLALTLPHPMDDERLDQLNAQLAEALVSGTDRTWIVDLSAVSYLNSAMLGWMVNLRHKIRAGQGRLILCGMSPAIEELFHNSAMQRLFLIVKDRKTALSM
ncbi:MAG: STAS domain-containing protein [Phycisphaerae bacterium]|nr:STAS domain-containing protein [Phycisphaerae bacterium]